MNNGDPILRADYDARELFDRLSKTAHGFTVDAVVGASLNMIVNAIRQAHATQRAANDAVDNLAAQAKTILDNCYLPNGGRRPVFAFDQEIRIEKVDFRKERKWPRVG